MKIVETRVFEKYEYQGYLITIQDYYGTHQLEGIAVPTKYAHLFDDLSDVEMCYQIFEQHGIKHTEMIYDDEEKEYYEEDLIHLIGFDSDSIWCCLGEVPTASQVLSFMVDEINNKLNINPKTIVLKQVYKKTIAPKVSKNKRGFNQVAWATMIKLRDGKCTECSSVYDLHAHHIKSFKDNENLRYDVNNGITLCGQCHRKWHKENGR